ncbi:hypothetical protein [Bradyrhizobium sp.]|uniref:hypothetical protein n=1 Tax=Bradyrhizobium sp. TaxID=376 RepID=UPI003C7E2915
MTLLALLLAIDAALHALDARAAAAKRTMNSGCYGRLFARAMQFRQQRCLHLEQIRYQLTDKIENRQFGARPLSK